MHRSWAPLRWSAETPHLYTLALTLRDAAGKIQEVIPWRVGFRSVETKNGQLLVNGRPVKLRGFRVAVVLRGYGGNNSAAIAVDARSSVALVGDEALVLQARTGCPVAAWAIAGCGSRISDWRAFKAITA